MTDAPVIEVTGVSKSYGGVVANENVSLTVPSGGITGLIGPIAFDARGDNLRGTVTIYQVRGGKLVVAP